MGFGRWCLAKEEGARGGGGGLAHGSGGVRPGMGWRIIRLRTKAVNPRGHKGEQGLAVSCCPSAFIGAPRRDFNSGEGAKRPASPDQAGLLRAQPLNAAVAFAMQGQLPPRVQVWGQTLDPSKPSLAQNRALVTRAAAAANTTHQQQQQTRGRRPDLSPSSAHQLGSPYSSSKHSNAGTSGSSSSSSLLGSAAAAAAADSVAAEAFNAAGAVMGSSGEESSEDEDDSSSYGSDLLAQVAQGQTWLIMEFCDKGCLQVGDPPWGCVLCPGR
jgi:hypothetical protein